MRLATATIRSQGAERLWPKPVPEPFVRFRNPNKFPWGHSTHAQPSRATSGVSVSHFRVIVSLSRGILSYRFDPNGVRLCGRRPLLGYFFYPLSMLDAFLPLVCGAVSRRSNLATATLFRAAILPRTSLGDFRLCGRCRGSSPSGAGCFARDGIVLSAPIRSDQQRACARNQ